MFNGSFGLSTKRNSVSSMMQLESIDPCRLQMTDTIAE
jgi:hypothetical protein